LGVNGVTVLEMSEMQSLRNPSASIEHFNQGRHDVESVKLMVRNAIFVVRDSPTMPGEQEQ
jgi:hypothetical protein